MIEVVITCVVEIGIPSRLATKITVAAVVWAAKPWMGCIRTILLPSVFMMRRPPMAVPAAIVNAQATLIQLATVNSGVFRKWSQGGTLVNVPLIPLVGLHLLDVSLRFLRRLAALLLHNCPQGCINIFRHLQRITANVKIRSGVEPAP